MAVHVCMCMWMDVMVIMPWDSCIWCGRGALSLSLDVYIYIYFVCIRFPLSDGCLILWGPPFFQSSVFTGQSLLLNMWAHFFLAVCSCGVILLFNRFGVLAFWPSPKTGIKKTQKKRKDSQHGEFKNWRRWWGFPYQKSKWDKIIFFYYYNVFS